MKRILVLTMSLLVLTLTACQTVKGFGQDVQKAGNWMEKEANKHM